MWDIKYKPSSLEEIPQPLATLALSQAIKTSKAILIHGPSGTGKTSAVYALAQEQNYEILEVNASDTRNKEQIEKIIGESSQQHSLFMKKKIILIDEIDGIAGQQDRGGAQAVKEVLEKTKHPVIMTCNDSDNEKLKDIKKMSTLIAFERISEEEIKKVLKNIAEKEQREVADTELKAIALNANGDLRAAILDLWTTTATQQPLHLESRDAEESIQKALEKVFTEERCKEQSLAAEFANTDIDEFSSWMEENLCEELKTNEERARAFQSLAKADVFKSRITRWQYWRFLVYQNIFSTAGVASARSATKRKPIKYKRPTRGLKIWMANIRLAKKKAKTEILARHCHRSKKSVFKEFAYYDNILKNKNILNTFKEEEREILIQ